LPDNRAALTADDLRKLGSVTIKNADRVRYAGWLTGALGLTGLGKSGACALNPSVCAGGLPTVADPSPDSLVQSLDKISSVFGKTGNPDLNHAFEVLQQALRETATHLPAAKAAASTAVGPLVDTLGAVLPYVGALVPGPTGALVSLGLGIAFNLFGSNIIGRRVQDQRDGKHIGPANF
jgi:hypothetical protein